MLGIYATRKSGFFPPKTSELWLKNSWWSYLTDHLGSGDGIDYLSNLKLDRHQQYGKQDGMPGCCESKCCSGTIEGNTWDWCGIDFFNDFSRWHQKSSDISILKRFFSLQKIARFQTLGSESHLLPSSADEDSNRTRVQSYQDEFRWMRNIPRGFSASSSQESKIFDPVLHPFWLLIGPQVFIGFKKIHPATCIKLVEAILGRTQESSKRSRSFLRSIRHLGLALVLWGRCVLSPLLLGIFFDFFGLICVFKFMVW